MLHVLVRLATVGRTAGGMYIKFSDYLKHKKHDDDTYRVCNIFFIRHYDLHNVTSAVKNTCFPAKRTTCNSPQKLSKTYILPFYMSLKFEAQFNRTGTTLNHVFRRNNVFCKLPILRGHYNKPIGMEAEFSR